MRSWWLKLRKHNCGFEAAMAVNNPDIKVVQATYQSKLILLAIGTSTERELSVSGEGSVSNIGAKYQSQNQLNWRIIVNRKDFPDFVLLDNKLDRKN